jgi:hypothetical protein
MASASLNALAEHSPVFAVKQVCFMGYSLRLIAASFDAADHACGGKRNSWRGCLSTGFGAYDDSDDSGFPIAESEQEIPRPCPKPAAFAAVQHSTLSGNRPPAGPFDGKNHLRHPRA